MLKVVGYDWLERRAEEAIETRDVNDNVTEEELTRAWIKRLQDKLKRLGVDPPKEEVETVSGDKKDLIRSLMPLPSACVAADLQERPPILYQGKIKLLPSGTIGELNGAGGVSKSMLALTLACSVSAGRTYAFFNVDRPHRVGYWANEDDQGELMRRTKTICANMRFTSEEMALIDANLVVLPARGIVGAAMTQTKYGFRVTPDGEVMRELLAEANPELIIIDTRARAEGGLESADSGAFWLSFLEGISNQTGSAIIALHHTGKGRANEHSQYSSRGSSVVSDGCRFMWGLMPTDPKLLGSMDDEEKARYVSFKLTKSNYGPSGLIKHIRRNDDGFLEEVDLTRGKMLQEAIVLCKWLSHSDELTENELLKEAKGADIREGLKEEIGATREGIRAILEFAKNCGLVSLCETSAGKRGKSILCVTNMTDSTWN